MRKTLMTFLLFALTMAQASGQTVKTWMNSPTLVADGKTVTYLTVYQTTDDEDELYRSFEIHLTVPEGISIAQRKEGRKMVDDISLNAIRFDGLPQTLAVSMPNSTSITAVCVNTTNKETYYRDDEDGNIIEELFTIGLVADPDMANGKYDVEMTIAKFELPTGGGVTLTSPAKSTMTITGGQGSADELLYTLGGSGYGTLILPFEAELPDGVKAYTCTGLEGQSVVMKEQSIVPACTPVVLSGIPGSYTFTGTGTASEDCYTSGLLTGVMKETQIEDGYVLQQQGGVTGFYFVDANAPKTVPANRCYLNIPAAVKMLSIGMDADAIEEIVKKGKAIIYDLNGRRVTGEVRGVKVKEGRKIINK